MLFLVLRKFKGIFFCFYFIIVFLGAMCLNLCFAITLYIMYELQIVLPYIYYYLAGAVAIAT